MTSPIRFQDESGTALVEFAFVLPLLLVLILGIVDFGRAFNYWIDSTHVANVAARYAAVNKNPGGSDPLQSYMKKQGSTAELRDGVQAPAASGVDKPGLRVCISFPNGTSNVGDPVRVEVTSTFSWLHYLVGRAGLAPKTQIKGAATMRLEGNPSTYSAGCA